MSTDLAIPDTSAIEQASDPAQEARRRRSCGPCTIVLVIDAEFAVAWAATHPTPAAVAS